MAGSGGLVQPRSMSHKIKNTNTAEQVKQLPDSAEGTRFLQTGVHDSVDTPNDCRRHSITWGRQTPRPGRHRHHSPRSSDGNARSKGCAPCCRRRAWCA
jgi:hypothetical protein